MTTRQKRRYILFYTGVILALLPLAYCAFSGRTFIRKGDVFKQHYRAALYYRQWLRSVAKTLLQEHRLVLPEWDFSIGYGSNILTTLHYYVVGDPINLLSMFVPERYMPQFFSLLIFLRSYLAGLAFSWLCIYKKRTNSMAILAGAITYVFVGYVLRFGFYHPFFQNPMICFPLVILGVEKLLCEKKTCTLVLSVFYSAVSNFYFFYMIVLLTVGYVLIRCGCAYGWKGRKEAFGKILQIGLYAGLGVMLSAFLFVPVIRAVLSDHRMETEALVPWHYWKTYYEKLPSAFIITRDPGVQTYLGYGVHALFGVVLLFFGKRRKEHGKLLKMLFLAGSLMLLFPFAAHALNAFSYVVNRWTWAYSLLVAYIFCTVWEDFFDVRRRDLVCFLLLAAVYVLWLRKVRWQYLFFPALILLCALSRALLKKRGKMKMLLQASLLLLVAGSAVINANMFVRSGNFVKKFLPETTLQAGLTRTPDKAVLELMEGEDFFRYGGEAIVQNSSVNAGTHSIDFYWSISNHNIVDFFQQTQVNVPWLYVYTGLDERCALTALAGCRYYLLPKDTGQRLPYGFHYLKTNGQYDIYENEYALPLGYTYDSYITREQLEQKNGVEKEEAMMQDVILDAELQNFSKGTPDTAGYRLDYSTELSQKGIEKKGNAFLVTGEEAAVTLKIPAAAQDGSAETYFCMDHFSYKGKAKTLNMVLTCTMADGQTNKNRIYYSTQNGSWPSELQDYMVNLGSGDSPVTEIRLQFDQPGEYDFDEIYVWRRPLQDFAEQIAARKEDVLENEEVGTDVVKGTVDLEQDKILLLAIPYDGGWTAYVDGKKQEVLKANYMFSALPLAAGHHDIVLKYRTPLLNIGMCISALGILLFAGTVLWKKRGQGLPQAALRKMGQEVRRKE